MDGTGHAAELQQYGDGFQMVEMANEILWLWTVDARWLFIGFYNFIRFFFVFVEQRPALSFFVDRMAVSLSSLWFCFFFGFSRGLFRNAWTKSQSIGRPMLRTPVVCQPRCQTNDWILAFFICCVLFWFSNRVFPQPDIAGQLRKNPRQISLGSSARWYSMFFFDNCATTKLWFAVRSPNEVIVGIGFSSFSFLFEFQLLNGQLWTVFFLGCRFFPHLILFVSRSLSVDLFDGFHRGKAGSELSHPKECIKISLSEGNLF